MAGVVAEEAAAEEAAAHVLHPEVAVVITTVVVVIVLPLSMSVVTIITITTAVPKIAMMCLTKTIVLAAVEAVQSREPSLRYFSAASAAF